MFLSFFEKMSIRSKVLSFGIIMSILPVFFVSLFYISFIRGTMEEKITQNQLLYAKNLAYEIESQFKEIDKMTWDLFQLYNEKDEQGIYEWLKLETSIEEISFLSEDGVIKKQYHRFQLNSITNDEQWEHFYKTKEKEKVVSEVQFNTYGQPILTILSSFKKDGEFINVKLTIQVQKLLGKIQSTHIENNGLIYLMDENEQIIAHQDFSKLFQKNTSNLEEENVLFRSKINELDWTLVLEQPKTFTYEPITELIKNSIIVSLCFLLLVTIISIQAGIYFTQPILELKSAMRKLKIFPQTRVAETIANRSDELGELAYIFNEMGQTLQVRNALLKQETDKLGAVIQGIPADFVIWDKQKKLKWLKKSQKTVQFLEQAISQLLLEKESLLDNQANYLKTQKLHWQEKNKVYQIRFFPLIENEAEQLLIMVEDITETYNLEAKLAQADKLSALGMLASGFAHEVNNPLTVISVYTEDLEDRLDNEVLTKEEIQEYLMKIQFNVQRCKTITSNLLNFSRQTNWETDKLNLKTEIENAVLLIEHEMKRNQVQLMITDMPTCHIHGDRLKFIQVIVNLLQNAIDAVPKGTGVIEIQLVKTDSNVIVEIIDNGTGISEEDLQKIMNPFFTTKPVGKGTGLGLFISYNIMQQFGGTIEFQSKKDGGTKVILTFPLKGEL